MLYADEYSYCYSSGDDSFSYILDSSYCPIHNTVPPPPPSIGICTLHQPYSYYNYVPVVQQQQQQQQQQVSNKINSSSSIFQIRPEKTRRFSSEQIRILEEHFYKIDKYLSKITIDDLSTRTQLTPAQIRVWFNNKRTREYR
ncbi:unnamed protein product [Rotaria sp. Silwood2]|nr:unnamed protein product [Rotaria sp. Silwood2]CAF3166559.1 unnamed protein product [Rotaria sp. Silwood2]CAF3576506.1 unnamed protein product [Rotaria sp. Silwood2]CAF4330546.1 unnamed protein product [Rotaria sp. Silwood2]CAF4520576.1 unnamed protein product [Rotaria sp. Silwood2]